MNKMFLGLIVGIVVLTIGIAGSAESDKSDVESRKNLTYGPVYNTIEKIKEIGIKSVVESINAGDSFYKDLEKDLYVFIYETNEANNTCVMIANSNPDSQKLIGQDLYNTPVSSTDKYMFRKDMVNKTLGKTGKTWVYYKYPNPKKGGQIGDKATFCQRFGNYLICCGIYI